MSSDQALQSPHPAHVPVGHGIAFEGPCLHRLTLSDGARPEASRGMEPLHESIGPGHLDLHAMPVVSLWDGRLMGVEALARWRTPDGRVLLPNQFLPKVAAAGLWGKLDEAALRVAVGAANALPGDIGIGVNLSAATLARPDLADWLLEVLQGVDLQSSRLHLELTETSLLRVDDRVTDTMTMVAATGVRWWMDDFGTGNSSISHLRDLPISGIKLDRSFTAGITDGRSRNARLTLGLAGLAAGLGLDTIAEGVETRQQAQALAEQGWQMGQGWLFGAPEELSAICLCE